MTFEELQFCLDTVKRGDKLFIGYESSWLHREYTNLIPITNEKISKVVEMLITPKIAKERRPYGFYNLEVNVTRDASLIRMHKNKYFDMYGNKVEIV